MIPAAFVSLESWPLTTSGKVNRKALPDPEIVGAAAFIAPASTQEVLLCRLFAELTGATRVSIEDNFFALGGHSLLAMRLVSAVREATHRELPLRAVFEQPTPRGLGALLAQAERKVLPPIVLGSGLDSLGSPHALLGTGASVDARSDGRWFQSVQHAIEPLSCLGL